MSGLAPCHRSRNRAFIDPEAAPDRSVRAARVICAHCPIRRECTARALVAGTSLDGATTAPATGVIAAGVVCRGDQATARALAAVAGVKPPTYRLTRPRRWAPDRCVECAQPMAKWSREGPPEGYRLHYARGYCTDCRPSYRAELEAVEDRRTTRSRVRRVPDRCTDCATPMVSRGRPVPEGHVEHGGRGQCNQCYARRRYRRKKESMHAR